MYPSNAGNRTTQVLIISYGHGSIVGSSVQPTHTHRRMDMPPPAFPTQTQWQVPWSTGLGDCWDDVPLSCGMNGAIYAIIAYFTGCACFYSCFYRTKLRHQYSLQESPCGDCLVHFCCESCALCQEYRKLKSRGFNMAIGWPANVEQQNHGVAMAPVVQGSMTR